MKITSNCCYLYFFDVNFLFFFSKSNFLKQFFKNNFITMMVAQTSLEHIGAFGH